MSQAILTERVGRTSVFVGWWATTAVGIYVTATVLGGLLDPSYSHVSMHVSELPSSHAPNRVLLAGMYVGYNAALGGLGFALLKHLKRSRWLVVASWLLVANAVAGVLTVTWFPQDSYGYPSTTAGAVHISLGGVLALLSILVMFTAGRAFRSHMAWATLGRFSTAAAVVMVVTGLATAVATAAASPYMGLLERLPIGTFLLWLAAVAWYGFRYQPELSPAAGGSVDGY